MSLKTYKQYAELIKLIQRDNWAIESSFCEEEGFWEINVGADALKIHTQMDGWRVVNENEGVEVGVPATNWMYVVNMVKRELMIDDSIEHLQ